MSLLTTTEILTHIETDLETTALQRIIDAEEEEIVSRFGAHTSLTEEHVGGDLFLFLGRVISSITTVTEIEGTTETVLAANDYALRHSNRAIERLSTGTNARTAWAKRVRVVYAPDQDAARRKRVLIDLVQLATQYHGVKEESSGNWSSGYPDYQRERDAILSTLLTKQKLFA